MIEDEKLANLSMALSQIRALTRKQLYTIFSRTASDNDFYKLNDVLSFVELAERQRILMMTWEIELSLTTTLTSISDFKELLKKMPGCAPSEKVLEIHIAELEASMLNV